MIVDIFENREKTVWKLFQLAECLGRSLRENVSLFYIDSSESKVSYITENSKVITAEYNIKDSATLRNIKIQESSVFSEGTAFEEMVSDKVHSFVGSLSNNDYESSDTNFGDILKLWEYRVKFDKIKNSLEEKAQRFDETHKILPTVEIKKLIEITPTLISYLSENKEEFNGISQIVNAVKLSNSVSKAFNIPAVSYQDLEECGDYTLKGNMSDSIFEMICKQELVKKELLESKKSFDTIWATNNTIKHLVSVMFENDDVIAESLSEVLSEVPYMALVSKATLSETFSRSLSFIENSPVSEKDIKTFSSKIFEMKKPIREEIVKILNEEYGINVQNLKESPSFKSLLNTQVVIFESLSRLSPKNSLQKKTLSEVADMLKYKTGVESIDINDYLCALFTSAGYTSLVEEKAEKKSQGKKSAKKGDDQKYMSKPEVNFDEVKKDLKQIGSLFDIIKKNMQYNSDETLESQAAKNEGPEQAAAPAPAKEDAAPPVAPEQSSDGGSPNPNAVTSNDDVVSNLSDLEQLVNDLADQLGMSSSDTPDNDKNKEEEEAKE